MHLKKLFINRKDELKQLINGLKIGNDFILIAPRRFGKSVLAIKALEEIKQDKKFITIDIDLMKYSGGSIRSVAECIIEKLLNSLGMQGKLRKIWREIDFTFNLKFKYKNLEIEPLLQIFKENTDEWILLEDALDFAEKVAIQLKKNLVIFYDEFGELFYLGERVIKLFRSVLQRHKHVSYLFAGSQETIMNKIFLDKSGAFYRFGELIYLKELNKEDVFNYILETYPETNQKSDLKEMTLLNAILTELRGHPYYTAKVISYLEINKKASLESYYKFLYEDLIENESAYLTLELSKLKNKLHALDVIRILALKLNPYDELTIKEQNVYSILQYLQETGFIRKKSRGEYILTDPLLEKFLIDENKF